ncbi:MAG: type II secretion system protein, partial [Planctomycetota bacterium]
MQRRGFTLLELIVVLTILGFLAAMVLPRVGRMSTAERIKLTQDRLEQVRAAIVGPRYVFDEHGQPKIGGYVGDVGALPELVRGYLSDGKNKEWHDDGAANGDFESGFDHDSGSMQWVWDFTAPSDYDASADWTIDGLLLNHPGGLFEDPGIDGWQGPYCGPGKDIYRNDHSAYAETVKAGDVGDTRAWAMRITTNRLDDAWGRSLLFWLEDVGADGDPTNDSLWIISEGSDQKSEWIAGEYQPNKDKDLYVIITANEWYVPLEDLTLQRMELIRTAIVGPRNRFDAQGRIAIGGYVREHGHLPDDLDAIATMDMVQLGSDWRSDAWGNQFTITPDHDEGTLIVASAGPTADAGDDL